MFVCCQIFHIWTKGRRRELRWNQQAAAITADGSVPVSQAHTPKNISLFNPRSYTIELYLTAYD